MQHLIPVVNKLQDVFAACEIEDPINLPQIVVVGSQSSGKSSVLESIVGRDFLPRGSGIVTRRPLLLQLIHKRYARMVAPDEQEWGEFNHIPDRKFFDFAEIKAEIERETELRAGKNKAISPLPIRLRIYSPNVPNLTLVDLPGLTKNPVGDQPKNIEELIRQMISVYIQNPNSIILAVSSANTDLANSDALKLAREVDPEGERTVGVLTKLDIMDKGTDAMDVLTGRVYPLRLGFVGVVLRSQQDINTNKPITEAHKAEKSFFDNHPLYKAISDRNGTPFLARTLNKILMQHIRANLPELRQRVSAILDASQKELLELGDPQIGQSKGALLLHIITTFSNIYSQTIDGSLPNFTTDELYGGARISFIFNDVFGNYVESLDAVGNLSTHEVQMSMSNATGPRSALFVPEESFDQLAKKLIRQLEEPCLQCCDMVFDELHQIVDGIDVAELRRFDILREQIKEVVHALLAQCRVPAREMIRDMIAMEQSYINTSHPDFTGGGKAIQRILQQRAQKQIERGHGDYTNPFNSVHPPTDIPFEYQAQYSQQYQREIEKRRQEELKAQREKELARKREQEERDKQEAMRKQNQSQQSQPQSGFFNLFGLVGSTKKAPTSSPAPSSSPNSSSPLTNSANLSSSRANPQTISPSRMQTAPSNITSSRQDDFQTELIRSLLESYFSIVRKTVRDRVPKSIMHFMVNTSKEKLQSELVKNLYKEERIETLLAEAPDVSQQRDKMIRTVDVLRKAQMILSEIEISPVPGM